MKLLLVFFSLLTGLEVTFGNENGAATKPYVTIVDQTKDKALLQCEVQGAILKPKLRWQDSDGNILHAKEPKESKRGGRYDIILQTTVTKTDRYRCVATQEEINHQIYAETHVYVSGVPIGWVVAAVFGVLGIIVLAVLIWKGYITLHCKKRRGTTNLQGGDEGVQLNNINHVND